VSRVLESGADGGRGFGIAAAGREKARLVDTAVILVLSFAFVFGVVRPFVVEPFHIPSKSMALTLQAGDQVLAAKFAYRLGEPGRGDLVVFEGGGEIAVKRIVGVGGDRVAIKDGVLFVNGRSRSEPYVNRRLVDGNYFGPVSVPEGHVFVMGDNRANSRDSRVFGSLSEDDLLGRVFLRFWPLGRLGIL
jgi:signal peptidase I